MKQQLMTQYVAMPDTVSGVYAATFENPDEWMWDAFGAPRSDSGVRVTADTALQFAPWFQGIATISADVARIPLDIYERDADDNRIKHRDHQAYELLNRRVNDRMTAFTLREILQAHALSMGNGYAAIKRRGVFIDSLVPLDPSRVIPTTLDTGRFFYAYRNDDGSIETWDPEYILHIKGLGYDGLQGYSVYRYARNSLGLGMATEKHGSTHFRNNAMPGLALKYPGRLDKPDADKLLAQWEERHAGSDNTSRPALLSGGLDLVTLPISNEDAQWIESRKFQRDEVASWLNLPPHKLGSDSRLSYNSVEAEERSYVSQTLMRWFRRWEAECDVKLLSASEQQRWWYFEHQTGALIQGDFKTQADVAVALKNAMIITRNEARKKFNLNSVDGGDEFENANTSTSGTADPTPNEAVDAAMSLTRERVKHLVTTECTAIRRYVKSSDPDASLTKFYSQFREKVAEAIAPCIRMLKAVGCQSIDAEEYAETHCKLSLASLRDMATSESWDNLDTELQSWLLVRPRDAIHLITGG